MFSKIVLALWSGAGFAWWLLAWRLVAADQSERKVISDTSPRRTLSIFKPLPPLGAIGLKLVGGGLESFIAQLDADSELLLGIHEADRDCTAPFINRLRTEFPSARVKVIFRTKPDDVANPKIAWQKILAPHAEGDLWLWSDADIFAPPGFLQSARFEFARCNSVMMTFPYIVREVPRSPALMETLFVNVEFSPGVLLLRRLGQVDFGLGAAMLFQRDDFVQRIDWDEIGAWLGDDFVLGQELQPVQIGTTTLATVPNSVTWRDALSHDLRWAKTIRWNRPLGAFARILIMPVLGWLVAVGLYPQSFFAWFGLVGMIQAEVFFAALICRRIGCSLKLGDMAGLEFWSLWRIILWFLSWLPWPVLWNGKMWWRPRVKESREIYEQSQGYLTEAVDKHARKSDLF